MFTKDSKDVLFSRNSYCGMWPKTSYTVAVLTWQVLYVLELKKKKTRTRQRISLKQVMKML